MNQPVTRQQIMTQARGESASQATVIEQSRAIAEVQAAFVMAQQRPRDEAVSLTRIREACKQLSLAEQAFFKFPRGGETVSGESIHLAVELARCWGNVSYGIKELSRNDQARESEMLAYALDLETNTRSEMGFIVPHLRDTRTGVKPLVDMRDIYENNANMGARRLRECIFRILPTHVREIGKATCLETLEKGESEKPLAVRLAELFEHAEKMGISRDRIDAKLGKNLTAVDAANLHVSLRSVKRGEVSAEEEFPRVAVEETTAAARKLVDESKSKSKPEPEPKDDAPKESSQADDDGHGDEDDVHPARKAADDIIRSAQLAGNIIDLMNIKNGRAKDIEAMPEEIAAEVNKALDSHELRLRQKNKK